MLINKNNILTTALIIGICLLSINSFYTTRLFLAIGEVQGKLEILNEIRVATQNQQALYASQLNRTDKQIEVLAKLDSSITLGFATYANNLKSLKAKYYEKSNTIKSYGSDDIKKYFAGLTEPE